MSVVRGSSDPYGEQGETLFVGPYTIQPLYSKVFLKFLWL